MILNTIIFGTKSPTHIENIMKIVIYGNFSVDYCSEVHHAKSIEALGHEVIRLQETVVPTDALLTYCKHADLFVWIHSHGFVNKGTRTMTEILEILERNNIPSLAYHLDLYMGLERWKEYEHSDYFKVKYFFTVDKLMADWLNTNTKTKGFYIPAGVLHEEAYSLNLPKVNDVIFVGSKGYHKEWPYRPQIIDWLANTYGDKFKHYGGDGLGVTRGHDLNKLYAQSKIVIGDTLCPNFDYPYYFSDRIFETIGRGGFIIHPEIKGLEDCFDIHHELITYKYGDFTTLKRLIDFFLDNDAQREEMRGRAFERVVRDHTYYHRWEQILNKIKS
jgi:glycosyl transferase family 1